jgi:hypothetical protein
MMEEALVAARDLNVGMELDESMLAVVELPKGGLVKKGFKKGEEKALIGRRLAYPMNGKQQFTADSFLDDAQDIKDGESCFVIPADWIAMRSSALRRGDRVEIFGEDASASFGEYRLAFVKNEHDAEVRDVSARGEPMAEPAPMNKRVDADSSIDHVEIITNARAYYRLKAYAESREDGPCLVLVRLAR